MASKALDTGSSPLTRGKRFISSLVTLWLRLIPAHAGKTACECPDADGGGAHPRSRGENINTWGGANTMSGSSPLTRGKPGGTPVRPPPIGLIPAHAGKTKSPAQKT